MTRPTIARGDIFAARLNPTEGSQQAGTRPVLIVSNDSFNTVMPVVTVIPITTLSPGRRVYASEVVIAKGEAGLRADSLALCHQIRTIAISRLGRRIGSTDPSTVDQIDDALRTHLGL